MATATVQKVRVKVDGSEYEVEVDPSAFGGTGTFTLRTASGAQLVTFAVTFAQKLERKTPVTLPADRICMAAYKKCLKEGILKAE
jgi:hypothetical protein